MEIRNATSAGVLGAAPSKPQADAVVRQQHLSERVSTLDVHRAADVARGVLAGVGKMRLVRLAHIGEAIRAGNYQPSASQVASKLLDAAEIDEHLQAILRG
jgi:anti-sigma28 factor (negative regulator of flagellin synthesis)